MKISPVAGSLFHEKEHPKTLYEHRCNRCGTTALRKHKTGSFVCEDCDSERRKKRARVYNATRAALIHGPALSGKS